MFDKVLMTTDGSKFAEEAVTIGVALAKECGAQLRAVSVVENPVFYGTPEATALYDAEFYQSLAGSLLLYRDPAWARQLFSESSDYLRMNEDDSPEQFSFFSMSPELSRRFRALPFFLSMRHYGIDRLGRNALHNVRCAEHLAELIRAAADLELVAAPQLSILCFRYRPDGLPAAEIDRLNTEIRDRIQQQGDYLISPTQVNGRPVLRVCIINHATRVEHVEGLFDSILDIGRDLLAGQRDS